MKAPIQSRAYCYNEPAKAQQTQKTRRFYRAAMKVLGNDFTVAYHFNPGGIAVWGETYAKFYRDEKPIVEAYDTSMGMLVRQWDGRNSGANHYAQDLDTFIRLVNELAAKPFVRF